MREPALLWQVCIKKLANNFRFLRFFSHGLKFMQINHSSFTLLLFCLYVIRRQYSWKKIPWMINITTKQYNLDPQSNINRASTVFLISIVTFSLNMEEMRAHIISIEASRKQEWALVLSMIKINETHNIY